MTYSHDSFPQFNFRRENYLLSSFSICRNHKIISILILDTEEEVKAIETELPKRDLKILINDTWYTQIPELYYNPNKINGNLHNNRYAYHFEYDVSSTLEISDFKRINLQGGIRYGYATFKSIENNLKEKDIFNIISNIIPKPDCRKNKIKCSLYKRDFSPLVQYLTVNKQNLLFKGLYKSEESENQEIYLFYNNNINYDDYDRSNFRI